MEKHVESLVTKASEAKVADDAMKYSQAALNAAKALRDLAETKKYAV